MRPKLISLIVLACVFVALGPTSLGAPNAAFEKEIKALKFADNAINPSIQFWDGQTVAVLNRDGQGSRFFSFTAGTLLPELVVVPQIDHLVSVGMAGNAPVALGKTKDRWVLMKKASVGWVSIPGLESLQRAETPRIIPSTKGITVLSEKRLYRFSEGTWAAPISLPDVPRFNREFRPERWGAKQLLFGSQLFVGWDHGEWGGLVATLKLNDSKRTWQQVDGKRSVSALGMVGGDPVTGMTVDSAGHFWISAGCAHMSGMWRGLFSYDGARWKTVVHGAFDKSEGGLTSIPGETTDIMDVFAAPDGTVYLLAGALGVFACANGKITSVVAFDFYDIQHEVHDEGKIDYIVMCSANGLVVDGAGNVFVATNAFGIFCLLKASPGYQLKQVVFPR